MQNKLGNNFMTKTEIVSNLPVNVDVHHLSEKYKQRRESVAPKIVVCPPVEEMSETAGTFPSGGRIFRALSCRFPKRATDSDSMESSSSNESVNDRGDQDRSDDHSSQSTNESSSDGSERRRRHRSTVSLRRVFQSLNLSSRAHSCSPTEQSRKPKKQSQPKRILRSPVTYTYVRGLSGLPTQRVPRRVVCLTASGLNR